MINNNITQHQSVGWCFFRGGNGGGGMYSVADAFLRAVRSNTRISGRVRSLPRAE